jgi:hypothetical protein
MDGVKLPADLDRLLRQTMAEEPSVDFLPRVRERIETERPASRWWWRAGSLAGAAVASAVIAMIVFPRPIDDVGVPELPAPPPVISATAPTAPSNPTVLPAPAPAGEPVRAGVRRPRGVRAADVSGMPPVIVDRRQRAAVDQMMVMVARGRVTEENFALTVPPSLQPIRQRVGEIAVVPVEVSPIGSGGVLQVGPEPKQPPRPADAGFRP